MRRRRAATRAFMVALASLLLSPSALSPRLVLAQTVNEMVSVRGPVVVLEADPTDANTVLAAPPAVEGVMKAAATASFQPTYTGFSIEARNAFQRALDIWAGYISSPVPITVNARFETLPAGQLGEAGSGYVRDFAGAPSPATFYPDALANAFAGSDMDPSADIDATINSSRGDWYFGTGPTPVGQFNFTSVVLHEIGHGLGFVGFMDVIGANGSWGIGSPPRPAIFDRFTTDGSRTPLLNTSAYPNPSSALASALKSGNVYFDSPLTNPANGTGRPRLYAPATWTGGKSYVHLDESSYPPGDPNSLMTPVLSSSETVLSVGPLTLCIFEAMGWSTPQACPPSSTSSATVVSRTTVEPGDSITASATGVASANSSYTLKLASTSGNCPTGLSLGGLRNSDSGFNIPAVQRVIPTNATSGSRWLCWVRTGNPQDFSPPVQITVV